MMLVRVASLLVLAAVVTPVFAQPREAQTAPTSTPRLEGVVARIDLQSTMVQVGRPVLAVLSLENTSDEPIALAVPGMKNELPPANMGLPLVHVFSGTAGAGITVETEGRRAWEVPLRYQRPSSAPIITLAPHCGISTRVNLTHYFPALRNRGTFRITWAPYNGAVVSDTVVVQVTQLKQAEILTDYGRMTVRFYYEDAPKTIANFIELATDGFYTDKARTFHRILPGHAIMGGDPAGDGTGIRSDGKRLEPEFNNKPHQKGSLSMSLLEEDPNSASCQFFISYTRNKDWDGRYTVFGQLFGDESFNTLDKLMSVPIDEQGKPIQPLYIRMIEITNVPNSVPPPGTDGTLADTAIRDGAGSTSN